MWFIGSVTWLYYFEVGGSSVMKASQEGWPLLGLGLMYLFLGLSYFLMAKAIIRIPVGVAYAFWEGLGLTLITLVSVTFLDEGFSTQRAIGLGLIVCGTLLVHHGTVQSEKDE